MTHKLDPSILRAYDIRGVVGDSLHAEDCALIGQAFATMAAEKSGKSHPRIAVARDGRLSSTELADALINGLMQAGAEVLDCGLGPTPMLYYAVCADDLDGGLMVTGSHNPPSHNGIKMMMGLRSFFGDDIQALGERIVQNQLREAAGTKQTHPVFARYCKQLNDALIGKHLSLIWDCGNGASGEVVEALIEANSNNQHTTLFTEIDGTFPNHHPDPSVEANLADLRDALHKSNADIGLAFDGDGDRLGVVDDKGRMVSPDHLLMLFARDVLAGSPAAIIIADVKTSGTVFEDVRNHGGTAEMYKTGHSHIKTRMKEIGAAFAGEASGHIFFADKYYGFDDGIYAAIRLINLVAASGKKLSELVDALPTTFSTPEYRLEVEESQKFAIVEAVEAQLKSEHVDMITLDGVRVNTPDGWWLLRASNTQAVLNARCESTSQTGLDALIAQLGQTLAPYGVDVPA